LIFGLFRWASSQGGGVSEPDVASTFLIAKGGVCAITGIVLLVTKRR
jgi:hypothetical protein